LFFGHVILNSECLTYSIFVLNHFLNHLFRYVTILNVKPSL